MEISENTADRFARYTAKREQAGIIKKIAFHSCQTVRFFLLKKKSLNTGRNKIIRGAFMEVIWKKKSSLEEINRFNKESIVGYLGIEVIEQGKNYLKATMPVDNRTIQPFGILHGGASVVLAETLGSLASYMTMDDNHYSVGMEIKANHLKSVRHGLVTGKVEPVFFGKKTQIWDISIKNEQEQLTCVSRLSLIVMKGQL